ncbi:MAG: GldG family protein [Halofilum sp. (in: g-proteobacteria)]|nr:GldG family protein [Halofilum sp. (in: g-proteobacteria)]
MRMDARQRLRARLQNAAFFALLLAVTGLAAWLSQQYRFTADWTDTRRNTLTQKSRDVIGLLEQPIRMRAFVAEDARVRSQIRELVERYRRAGATVELEFINPETRPALARELGIRGSGEMLVGIGDGQERLQRISEQSITNALAQLGRDRTRWIVFLEGHGERDPLGDANFDLGTFGQRLRERGYRVQTLNLARQPVIPDNTDLLVLASPRSDYLPGELARLQQYLGRGRNLLWLTEPDAGGQLIELASALGVEPLPGVVVDRNARLHGADTPDFAVAGDYPGHPATRGFDRVTLFPRARAVVARAAHGWSPQPLVRTHEQSWTERDPLRAGERIRFDPGAETAGPLTLAVAATRGGRAGQRIAVVGDGDWLSNAYLGNGGNLELGLRLVGWLAGDDDARITIAPERPPDLNVALSRPLVLAIGFGFLLGLPALLAGTGFFIWLRRRRR